MQQEYDHYIYGLHSSCGGRELLPSIVAATNSILESYFDLSTITKASKTIDSYIDSTLRMILCYLMSILNPKIHLG